MIQQKFENDMDDKVKVIALYLPQYYPFKENDEWWGKGFTEWTNVGKAKPLFRGHYQPKVPADLGYYDLRLPEIAEQQAELARRAGVYAFCYWHYWFGEGKELLDMPFKRALKTGKPDFPFCLGWAAESWMAKYWNKDNTYGGKILIEQRFPGEEDNEKHFYSCLDAFKDPRYVKVDEKPFFLLYGLKNHPDVAGFINQWNNLIKKSGVADSFYFVGYANTKEEIMNCKGAKFDAISLNPLLVSPKFSGNSRYNIKIYFERLVDKLFKRPMRVDYEEIVDNCWNDEYLKEDFIPAIIPNWDHSSRSGIRGSVIINNTPEKWKKVCEKVVTNTRKKHNKFILLKSWNEWGEGNYMEPDLKYGNQYIDALGDCVNKK